MKKGLKIFLIIIACLFTCSIILKYTVFDVTYHGLKAVKKYDYSYESADVSDPKKQMDKMVKELGPCEKYTLNLRKRIIVIFVSEGMTLVGNYSDENYQKQKRYIINNYSFATNKDQEVFKYELDEKSAYEFYINNWHFYLLNEENDEYFIPETFRMVGFNDKDKKIAFLTFADFDRDCIGENNDEKDLQSFVNDYFKYNFKK